MADALCRWAYPASQAFSEVSLHGSVADDLEMRAFMEQEISDEKLCSCVFVKGGLVSIAPEGHSHIRSICSQETDITVTTRRGTKTLKDDEVVPSTHTPRGRVRTNLT